MQWFAGGVTRLKGVVDSGELADVTQGEDSAMATLHFTNGARGLFYASNCHTTDSPSVWRSTASAAHCCSTTTRSGA